MISGAATKIYEEDLEVRAEEAPSSMGPSSRSQSESDFISNGGWPLMQLLPLCCNPPGILHGPHVVLKGEEVGLLDHTVSNTATILSTVAQWQGQT